MLMSICSIVILPPLLYFLCKKSDNSKKKFNKRNAIIDNYRPLEI